MMYVLEDKPSNTYEEFSDDYVDTHLRGMNNRYFAHMCQCQFTTHSLEVNELNRRFDGPLKQSSITELSVSVTYDIVFYDQRLHLFNEYMDLESTEFAYSHSDVIDLQITSFVRNGKLYNYDYTELLSSIRCLNNDSNQIRHYK